MQNRTYARTFTRAGQGRATKRIEGIFSLAARFSEITKTVFHYAVLSNK